MTLHTGASRRARATAWLALCAATAAVAGCGGPDLGGSSRSGFDSGLSGNYGGLGGYGSRSSGSQRTDDKPAPSRGTYARMEFSFLLPDIQGNPFDHGENDVQVTFTRPSGRTVKVPAFFDGDTTWRVRYTPEEPGRHAIARISLNGKEVQPEKLDRREADAVGNPSPGFVRRDPRDRTRLSFDNGSTYYPIGMNIGWGETIPAMLGKLGKAGGNWSRVWMCHWDRKNLDWVMGQKLQPGTLDLEAARKWDAIIEAAEKAGVYVQVVLQHHGQYSSTTNPNWQDNPWNLKNGGWLSTADEFFTNSRAAALTRAKYRYIIARWGASPAVLAWELFNEVEWTDAMSHKNLDEVADWHTAMARFLREQDPYKHLVTSSSGMEPGLFGKDLDYYQPHVYPPDALSTIAGIDASKHDRPVFFGEIGPAGNLQADDGTFLHRALWASIVSGPGGAAQYWSWDVVDARDLYPRIASAAAFVRTSGIASRRSLAPVAIGVRTEQRATLDVSPGGGWGKAGQSEFTVTPAGQAAGLSQFPAFLQGKAHSEMGDSATFKVDFPKAGTFAVHVSQSARAGAHVVIFVDGQQAAEKAFAAAERDTGQKVAVEAKVPAGQHTVKVQNTGADWVVVNRFSLSDYAPALGVTGRSSKDYAAAWVYRRGVDATPAAGELTVAGLQPGRYRVTWWDSWEGKALPETEAAVGSTGVLTLTTPAVARDAAFFAARTTEREGANATRSGAQRPPAPPAGPETKVAPPNP